jgi:cell division protein FtsL
MVGWVSVLLTILGWLLALLLAAGIVWFRHQQEQARRQAESELVTEREAKQHELLRLTRSLEAAESHANTLQAALSDLSAHVSAVRIANVNFLEDMQNLLAARLNMLKEVALELGPAREALEAEISATTLHDRRERYGQHLSEVIQCLAYLSASIPERERDLEALSGFLEKLGGGRFDEAFEETSFEKLRKLLERLAEERRRVLLESVHRPGHLEFANTLKLRDALAKTQEEKRLEAAIRAQRARSVLDD